MSRFTLQDGTDICAPDIKDIDAEIIEHWQRRSKEAIHPVLRARYADAVWDLGEKITGTRPGIEYARIAIDAYLGAVSGNYCKDQIGGVLYAERALHISLGLNDRARIDQTKAVMFALADKSLAEPQSIGLWSFLFDSLYQPRNRRLALTVVEQERIIAVLEQILQRCSDPASPNFSPWAAKAAAERLAGHHAGTKDQSNVHRVIGAYGKAFESAAEKADPLLAMAWLQPVIDEYANRGMSDDAKRAQLASYEKGKGAQASFKSITVSHNITPEEVGQFTEAVTEGSVDEALSRIAFHFIPSAEDIREFLREMKDRAPLGSMFPTIRIEDGRHVARAGSVDEDPEGRLIMQMADYLHMRSMFLKLALDRVRERHHLDAEGLAAFLFRSPIYDSSRHTIILEGLRAFFGDDYVKAVHVLVPQIEYALRRLLGLMGEPMDKPTGQGTMDVKNLNQVLREESIKACFGEDAHLYLLTFLADRRGHNVRNRVCHGILPAEQITWWLANQIIHVLLVLAAVKQRTQPQTPRESEDTRSNMERSRNASPNVIAPESAFRISSSEN